MLAMSHLQQAVAIAVAVGPMQAVVAPRSWPWKSLGWSHFSLQHPLAEVCLSSVKTSFLIVKDVKHDFFFYLRVKLKKNY